MHCMHMPFEFFSKSRCDAMANKTVGSRFSFLPLLGRKRRRWVDFFHSFLDLASIIWYVRDGLSVSQVFLFIVRFLKYQERTAVLYSLCYAGTTNYRGKKWCGNNWKSNWLMCHFGKEKITGYQKSRQKRKIKFQFLQIVGIKLVNVFFFLLVFFHCKMILRSFNWWTDF